MRLKLLFLLLAISLLPLGVISYLEVESTLKLGDNLAERTRQAIIDQVSLRLHQWISDKADYVKSTRHLLIRTLEAQAREVERCLSLPIPKKTPTIYFSEEPQFGNSPPGMIKSDKYVRFDPALTHREPVMVTFDTATFRLAPGLSPQKVSPDLARLASMSQSYRFLYENFPSLIYWQHTALENGLSCVYPGHGQDPGNFDPRLRPWYQEAKSRNALISYGPYVDASTRELVLTLALPIRDPKGRFAGVTAMDIQVDDMASGLQLPKGWPDRSFAMLVKLEETDGRPNIHILSRPGYSADGQEWNEAFEPHILTSTNHRALGDLIRDMQTRSSCIARLPYDGEECLWGIESVHGTDLFVAAILPYQDLILEAKQAQIQALQHTHRLVARTGVVVFVVLGIVLMISFIGAKAVTRPILQLANAAREVASGNLNAKVNIHTHDELEGLGDAFNQMLPQLQDRLRIKQSLDLAREVQQHLLPSSAPSIPGFDLAGRSISCDEIGGDYYDYLDLSCGEKSRIGIVLGDVAGHGIASAMLMTTARSLLRAGAHTSNSAAEILTRVNRELTSDINGGRFMTFYFLTLYPTERIAYWSSAGQDPAIHYRAATADFSELAGNGVPLAIDTTSTYEEQGPVTLCPGDVILMGTDGIWEAPNSEGKRFSKDALRAIIREKAYCRAEEIVEAIVQSVAKFRGDHPQADDITLVAIKVLPI